MLTLIYGASSSVWLGLALLHYALFCAPLRHLPDKLQLENALLLVPAAHGLCAGLRLLDALIWDATGHNSALVQFVQLLAALGARVASNLGWLLVVKGFGSLRRQLGRMEWRTVLGLLMLGVLTDLLTMASDTAAWPGHVSRAAPSSSSSSP